MISETCTVAGFRRQREIAEQARKFVAGHVRLPIAARIQQAYGGNTITSGDLERRAGNSARLYLFV
jgi:hypothetical protein